MRHRGYDIRCERHRTRFRDTRKGMALQLIALFVLGFLVAADLMGAWR